MNKKILKNLIKSKDYDALFLDIMKKLGFDIYDNVLGVCSLDGCYYGYYTFVKDDLKLVLNYDCSGFNSKDFVDFIRKIKKHLYV